MSNVNNILPQYYLIICCEYYDKCAKIYEAHTQRIILSFRLERFLDLALTTHNKDEKNHNKIKKSVSHTHTGEPERSRFTNYVCIVLRVVTLWPHNYCHRSTLFLFSFSVEVKVKEAYSERKTVLRFKDSPLITITAIFLTFGHTEGDGIASFSDKFAIFRMEIRRLMNGVIKLLAASFLIDLKSR